MVTTSIHSKGIEQTKILFCGYTDINGKTQQSEIFGYSYKNIVASERQTESTVMGSFLYLSSSNIAEDIWWNISIGETG